MKDLKKLMEKHAGKEMSPMHKAAKMSMLKALKDEMSGMMKDDLQKPGLKKVEVASNDAEGLSHGLDKAKEMIDSADHGSEQDEPSEEAHEEHEGIASPDMYDVDHEMEADSEDGDSEGEQHPDEHHEPGLSAEEEEHMHKLMARHAKSKK